MTCEEPTLAKVGRLGRGKALRVLLGPVCVPSALAARTHWLKQHLTASRPGRGVLWQARRGRRCIAAAMIIRNPGRVGMLLHSPAWSQDVEMDALVKLVRVVRRDSLGEEMTLVQALVPVRASQDCQALHRAGLNKLAELIYMRRGLAEGRRRAVTDNGDLEWLRYGQFNDVQLAEIIASTYVGSSDCPGLIGRREMSDVVAGHKGHRGFCPQCWWVLLYKGAPAACLLMNDSPLGPMAEVVYLGVAPEMRGRGLGRALLNRAIDSARDRGKVSVELAVDGRNALARRLYEGAGFKEIFRRFAYIALRKGAGNEGSVGGL